MDPFLRTTLVAVITLAIAVRVQSCWVEKQCCETSWFDASSYPTYSECMAVPAGWRPDLVAIDSDPYNASNNILQTYVFIRPEVKLIFDMSDKDSSFWVKFHVQAYWLDPAISTLSAWSLVQSDNTPFWKPEFEIDQMLDKEILGSVQTKWVAMNRSVSSQYVSNLDVLPQRTYAGTSFTESEFQLTNMMTEYFVKYKISNSGEWRLDDYPFDSRTLSWRWMMRGMYKANVVVVPLGPVNLHNSSVDYEYHGSQQTDNLSRRIPGGWETDGDLTYKTIHFTLPTDTLPAYGLAQSISMDRDWTPQISTTFFPVFCCVLIGIFSVITPIKYAMPRFAASVIPMLTLATIKRSVDSALPLSAQGCLLEYWLGQNMAILALCASEALIGFKLYWDYGRPIQKAVDMHYSVALLIYMCIAPGFAVLVGEDQHTYSVVLSFLPPFMALILPIPGILYHLHWIRTQKAASGSHKEKKSSPKQMSVNPIVGCEMDFFDGETKAQRDQPGIVDEWMDRRLQNTFSGHTFGTDDLVVNDNDFQNLVTNSYHLLNTAVQPAGELEGFSLLTSLDQLKNSDLPTLPLGFPQYKDWFATNINLNPRFGDPIDAFGVKVVPCPSSPQ